MNRSVLPVLPENTDVIFVTGFGDKGVADTLDQLKTGIKPVFDGWTFKQTAIVPGAPYYRALQSPQKTASRVCGKIEKFACTNNIILIGDSYGALLALVAACRRDFQNILGLILIDGPLDPAIDVRPKKIGHRLYQRHYNGRKKLAEEFPRFCARRHRNGLDRTLSSITTLGTEKDNIVPPLSKRLTGVDHVSLPYNGHGLQTKPVALILNRIFKKIFATSRNGADKISRMTTGDH